MNIGNISHFWNTYIRKKPAVPKVSPAQSSEKKPGSDDPSRETMDYSDEKRAEASTHHYVYGSDGEKKPLDDDDHHPELDVDA